MDLDVVSKSGICIDKSNVFIIPFADTKSELHFRNYKNGFWALLASVGIKL